MAFEKGCVVKSTAGRDKGSLLLVLEVQQDRVLVCDGKERPLQRPKSKNPRHLTLTGINLDIEKAATNRAIKKTLRQFKEECDGKTIGG